jgi:hypothetical protein
LHLKANMWLEYVSDIPISKIQLFLSPLPIYTIEFPTAQRLFAPTFKITDISKIIGQLLIFFFSWYTVRLHWTYLCTTLVTKGGDTLSSRHVRIMCPRPKAQPPSTFTQTSI